MGHICYFTVLRSPAAASPSSAMVTASWAVDPGRCRLCRCVLTGWPASVDVRHRTCCAVGNSAYFRTVLGKVSSAYSSF